MAKCKNILILMAVISVIISCKKDSFLQASVKDKLITLKIDEQTLSSRISLTEENSVVVTKWEENDQLDVWPRVSGGTSTVYQTVNDVSQFKIASGAGTKSATFTGSIIGITEEYPEYLNVIYRKNITNSGTGIGNRDSDGAFQCDATHMLLTSDLNKAPLILAGVFQKTEEKTYSPVGGRLLHGGVLFKINISGMDKSKVVKQMTMVGQTDKNMGLRPSFCLTSDGKFDYISAGGAKSGVITLTSEDESVKTDENGNLTVYAYIVPKNITKLVSDRTINILYGDGKEVKVGILKFAGKTIELGKCYTVDFEISSESGNEGENDDTGAIEGVFTESLQIYSYPNVIVEAGKLGHLKKSEKYNVSVIQGDKEYGVYVMQDYNTLKAEGNAQAKNFMTTYNHTANFSFKNSIQVKISRRDGGSMSNAVVYPKQKNYQYYVSGNDLIITLDRWAYIYVQVPGLKDDPLFVFADPYEENIPSVEDSEVLNASMSIEDIRNRITTTTKSTIYFRPGVYSFGTQTNNTYPGYKIPILSNKNYYISGGAVVIGSFSGESGVSNTKFYGRGVITACGKERIANTDGIPFNLYNTGGGTNNLIEGLQFNNPAHFCILSRGELITQYTKMFGWWHQTDGWGAESNSTIQDCFIKVNDDYIKIYRSNQTAKNIVMYKQINGAGIQLGWGTYGAAQNGTIEDIYIVNEDAKTPGIGNTAVVDLMNNGGSEINNMHFKNFYIENKIQMFLCLNSNGGKLSNFTFENIYEQKGAYNMNNYIITQTSNKGTYENFEFINYYINDNKVFSEDDMNLKQGYASDKKLINEVKLVTPVFR